MKTKVLFYSGLFFLLFSMASAYGQKAKDYYKKGVNYYESGSYVEAEQQFTEALKLDPEFSKALYGRIDARKKLNKLPEVDSDYDILLNIHPKDDDLCVQAGKIALLLKNYEKASKLFVRATDISHRNVEAYQQNVFALTQLKKYEVALDEAETALAYTKDELNFYNRAYVLDSLGFYERAEKDYEKAIRKKSDFEEAIVGYAKLLVKLKRFEEANEYANKAIELNKKCRDAYVARSKVYKSKLDYQKAIDDLSKILVFAPDDVEIYNMRGDLYKDYKQFQDAIFNYTKAIELDKNNLTYLFKRATCYENVNDYKKAIKDYKHLSELVVDNDKYEKLIADTEKRLFELNRESEKPELKIKDPDIIENNIFEVKRGLNDFQITGIASDESKISSIIVDGQSVKFAHLPGTNDYRFESTIQCGDKKGFTIVVKDIYNNELNIAYTIKRTENISPQISLRAPVASHDGEIYLASLDPIIYIEGLIKDESLIKSIFIDGVTASYNIKNHNPTFSANIDITNKNSFTITVEDQYGNTTEKEYTLNREGATLSESNPMGKTWVVFIENSSYETFASIDGPTKDVTLMKSALSNYIIHNIIHKKNMSKSQLERFFSIELRDLVKSNKVNSLVVWYAGHGKVLNEIGYWIPVDAKRDDEFSYFNINSLKASMQAYSKDIAHTLVVTDACESGPSFYQAMRATPTIRTCNDATATRFKSSQVFSSAGYELATDDSQFTRTFANTLRFNSDACIPIEAIVLKVSSAVAQGGTQKPQFGKINGLEDENGTFFFMRKE